MRALVWCVWIGLAAVFPAFGQDAGALRRERNSLMERGFWKEAIAFYQEKLSPISDQESGVDLRNAVSALEKLNDPKAFDGLVENAISTHRKNAAVLLEAADAYAGAVKQGVVVGGNFERGFHRSGGVVVQTRYRDRVRSLQLLLEALELPMQPDSKAEGWRRVADALASDDLWDPQLLTPLDELPEWQDDGPLGMVETPWKDDAPVLYTLPKSWAKAGNDGERWRFALAEMAKQGPDWESRAVMSRADFLSKQFGAETLHRPGFGSEADSAVWKAILESLAEDEVFARTTAGLKRFTLPPEHHFIALYRSILESRSEGKFAAQRLSGIYLTRGQFEKAKAVIEESIARFGAGPDDVLRKQLDQIVGNWGRFGWAATVPLGTRPKLPMVFRNAGAIRFSAARVDMDQVVNDVMAYLEGNPIELSRGELNPSAIANRLVTEKGSKYLGETAVAWVKTLDPPEGHREKEVEIEVPVEKAGAWWLTAELEGGYRFHTLIWIVDTLLNEKDVDGSRQWWVADAASGAPVVGAEIRFFGYQVINRERKTPQERRMDVKTTSFTRTTDDDGRTLLKPADLPPDHEWMVIARKAGRTTAFFGFQPLPIADPEFANGNRDIAYGVTDRPLYRPGDRVHTKFFLRNVGYFEPDEAKFAGRTGTFRLYNGRGEEALKVSGLKTDELGAVECEAVIPKDAPLGGWSAVFSLEDQISGSVSFRVEEFRKPEYEVSIRAPEAPVKLGDKFTVKIEAAYFHGAPVRNAQVEAKVIRTTWSERWFPAGRWDWLYGQGSWWPAAETKWHPEWEEWSCEPRIGGPRPRFSPQEIVLEKTIPMGEDGSVSVEIDTKDAKERFGHEDSSYRIEAKVTDASRREESADGQVIAARRPFEIVVWPNRGFAAPGEEIEARLAAATLTGTPVVGAEGVLKLLKVTVDGSGEVSETEVMSWPVKTGTGGEFSQKFPAGGAGQYRLVANLSKDGGEVVTSGTMLNIHGEGTASPGDWKFGALELITDKSGYAVGETLKLRVNSDRPGAHVWLFLHVGGAKGMEPKRVRLDGKSLLVEVPLDRRDMPNMFIEAVSIYGAKVYRASKEVILPPEKKLIDVSVRPEKPRVGPRSKSFLKIQLRDADGHPVSGKAVVTVYDKALESVVGGPNAEEIHRVFWGWKNHPRGSGSSCSIPHPSGNLLEPDVPEMSELGELSSSMFFGMDEGMRGAGGLAMKTTMAAPETAMPAAGDVAPEPLVRTQFADLLKWQGEVVADADGVAEVPLEFSDDLTTWKARVWMLGSGTRVGEGTAEIISTKDLLVRLQAPRFLVEKDEVTISATVHNEHPVIKEVTVSLAIDGDGMEVIDAKPATVTVGSHEEARVDWRLRALREGNVKLRVVAKSNDDGDAIERGMPIRGNGLLRRESWSRAIHEERSAAKIEFEVPDHVRTDDTKLVVQFSPSLAAAAVDAVPYLANYPHGCTEQTLNRFLPTVIARRLLADMKVDLAALKTKRSRLNSQQLGDHEARREEWRQWRENPVFDEEELNKMTRAGLAKLGSMQNEDGGWGWFSGFGEQSYPHATAVVMHGLTVGKTIGVTPDDSVFNKGLNWLKRYEESQIDALKRYAVRQEKLREGLKPEAPTQFEKEKPDALDAFVRQVLGQAGVDHPLMVGQLFRNRVDLPVYGQVLLGLELHRLKDARLNETMTLVSQFEKTDNENQTTWLDLGNRDFRWVWYGSEIEANAWYLQLLSATKPADAKTRGLAKHLANGRRGGTYWNSTRDTALVIEALCSYLRASREGMPEMEVEVLVDGKPVTKTVINRDNLFSFDGKAVLDGKVVTPGKHVIEIRKSGPGSLYANAYLDVFSKEDRLRPAGLEIKVSRKVSKLMPVTGKGSKPDQKGTPTSVEAPRLKREPLSDGATLTSGDRLEAELLIESKNDYEYLIVSDPKAAGFEPVEALSGHVASGELAAYMEPRDRSVDFFIRSLPRGTHVLRYELRAESPGAFKALPVVGEGMYAPELRANSNDLKWKIRDRAQ